MGARLRGGRTISMLLGSNGLQAVIDESSDKFDNTGCAGTSSITKTTKMMAAAEITFLWFSRSEAFSE